MTRLELCCLLFIKKYWYHFAPAVCFLPLMAYLTFVCMYRAWSAFAAELSYQWHEDVSVPGISRGLLWVSWHGRRIGRKGRR